MVSLISCRTLARLRKRQEVREFFGLRGSGVDQDSAVFKHGSDLDLTSELMHDQPEHSAWFGEKRRWQVLDVLNPSEIVCVCAESV